MGAALRIVQAKGKGKKKRRRIENKERKGVRVEGKRSISSKAEPEKEDVRLLPPIRSKALGTHHETSTAAHA